MSFEQTILVLGPGKSGTSGLFGEIKAGAEQVAGAPIDYLFEPHGGEEIRRRFTRPFMAKMQLERLSKKDVDFSFLDDFDKVVMIVRDPRDAIVSRLLWQSSALPKLSNEVGFQRVLKLFRQKEADPQRLSVYKMYRRLEHISGVEGWLESALNVAFQPLKFKPLRCPRAFTVHYERYIDRDVAELEAFLGFGLVSNAPVLPEAQLTRRTGGYGSWRRWFTQEDQEKIVDPNAKRFQQLGYEDLSFRPSAEGLDPAEGSEHALRVATLRFARGEEDRRRIARQGAALAQSELSPPQAEGAT